MNDQMKIEVLREALQQVLDNESDDWAFIQEFGGYCLDESVKETIVRALEITE